WWAWAGWVRVVWTLVLILVGLFVILRVLIRRGRGGGLAGAFGGAGGSSAFGSRAGDAFTRITIYTAAVWILLVMFMIRLMQPTEPLASDQRVRPGPTAPADTD